MATFAPNDILFRLIKSDEKLELTAYKCPVGVWTIGWGHTLGVTPGMRITVEQAERFLQQDVEDAAQAVLDGLVQNARRALTHNQLRALTSFVFNIKRAKWPGSTLLRKLNAGDVNGAADEFDKWVNGTIDGKLTPLAGLKRRRAQEKALFLTPDTIEVQSLVGAVSVALKPHPPTPQVVEPTQPKALGQSRTVAGAGIAGTAAVAAPVLGALQEAKDQISPLLPYMDSLKYGLVALTLIGVAIVLYARISDHMRARA